LSLDKKTRLDGNVASGLGRCDEKCEACEVEAATAESAVVACRASQPWEGLDDRGGAIYSTISEGVGYCILCIDSSGMQSIRDGPDRPQSVAWPAGYRAFRTGGHVYTCTSGHLSIVIGKGTEAQGTWKDCAGGRAIHRASPSVMVEAG
jgi:hypothetical protein